MCVEIKTSYYLLVSWFAEEYGLKIETGKIPNSKEIDLISITNENRHETI